MFTPKKAGKFSKGKAAGQWRGGQEFIDGNIFYWKSQLSQPETFPQECSSTEKLVGTAFSG